MLELGMGRKNKRAERSEKREVQRQEQLRKNSVKKFKKAAWWTVSIAVVLFIVVMLFRSTAPYVGDFEPLELTAIAPTDHVKGNPDAPILVIKYSDFQCPACGFAADQVDGLLAEHGDQIAFVYRHFMVTQPRQTTELASQAAEAAARQDAFWEMHDILFQNQQEWSRGGNPRNLFIQYAGEIGLDTDVFARDLRDREIAALVTHSHRSAIQNNFRGTPTFLLNGQQVQFETIAAQFQ